jgi:hypothetical protein
MEAVIEEHECTRFERPKLKGRVVEYGFGLGICREQNLESAVKEKSIDDIRTHATPDAIAGLEHNRHYAGLQKTYGAGQS